ncbi:MAG: alpha-hydroxy-acid oxidizing protein [Acidobacteria bacterium]|nr:alpha-hydroxy-acid oxidizing protein [Acidobacteriota bacterium]
MLRSVRSLVRFARPEWRGSRRRLARCGNIDDLRRIAQRRLPAGVFDYIDGAAEDERTMAENAAAYGRVRIEPRILVDVAKVDASTTLLGRRMPYPLALAPTGFTRIAHWEGELAVARAAAKAGLPYALSTLGTRSIEELAAVSDGDKWFQLYVWRDRGLAKELMARAREAGFTCIMPTVDTAVLGRRERDVRRGFTLPPKIGPSTLVDGIRHPAWTWNLVRREPITFSSVAGHVGIDGSTAVALSTYVATQFDPSFSWRDIEWVRSEAGMPVMLKGVQSAADVRTAASIGVDAVVLSNHGGRQFEGAPAPLDLLPEVMDSVGESIEVLVDGGVRRGSDVVKAVRLGARAVLIGRPYLYGLAAAGEEGVSWVISHLTSGIDRTLRLTGAPAIADVVLHRDAAR